MNDTHLAMVVIFVMIVTFLTGVLTLIHWFFPRSCKHCKRRVIPGTRYVWYDPFGYGYAHFDLHNGCARQYFDYQEHREAPTVVTPDKGDINKLKPIPELYRFLLDESWLIILMLAGAVAVIITGSVLWGGIIGLLAAVGTRAISMLTLRYFFKINPRLVKPHPIY